MSADRLGDEAIRLRLLRLALLHGGRVPLTDLTPTIDAATRRSLEDRTLIERECFTTNTRGRRVRCLSLTDAGWRWLADNFAGDVSRSSQCGRELAVILRMMRRLLEDQNLTFGEAVAAHLAPTPPAHPATDAPRTEAQDHIRSALRELSRETGLARVRIADLRERLPAIPRATFDHALCALEELGEAVLYRLDNPLEIHEADQRAAIVTPTGQPRHLVYLKGT